MVRKTISLAAVAAAALVAGACGGGEDVTPDVVRVRSFSSIAALDGDVSSTAVTTSGDTVLTVGEESNEAGRRGFLAFNMLELAKESTSPDLESATLQIWAAQAVNDPFGALGEVIVERVNFGSTLFAPAYATYAIEPAGVLASSSEGWPTLVTLDITSVVHSVLSETSMGRMQLRLRHAKQACDDPRCASVSVTRWSAGEDEEHPPTVELKYHDR